VVAQDKEVPAWVANATVSAEESASEESDAEDAVEE